MAQRTPGELLQEFCEAMCIKHGINKRSFAQRIGWDTSTLYRLEQGKSTFKGDHLRALVNSPFMKEGDEWWTLFHDAIERSVQPPGKERARSAQEPRNPGAAPTEPSQRPRKSNKGLLIAVIVLVIGIGGIGCVVISQLLGLFDGKGGSPSTSTRADQTAAAMAAQTLVARAVEETVAAVSASGENTSAQGSSAPLPTSTPYPTYTPAPTYTAPPTQAPKPQATSTPRPEMMLPFEDNFDNGVRPEWEQVVGNWRMVDGGYWTDPSGAWSIALVGDVGWTNYALEVDVQYHNASAPRVGVIVRASNDSYMEFRTDCCSSDWYLHHNGEEQNIATTSDGGGLPREKDTVHWRFEIKEDIYSAYVDGQLLMRFQDDTLSSGRVGLTVANSKSYWRRFDNFKVTKLD